jgi:hypothetical protein
MAVDTTIGYSGGFVPTKPVLELMDDWMERIEADSPFQAISMLILELWPEGVIGLDLVEIGKTKYERTLRQLREQKWVNFDKADRIVCRLGGWRQSPGLEKAYERVNLLALDARHPTCPEARANVTEYLRGLKLELRSIAAVARATSLTPRLVSSTLEAAA